MFSLAPLLSLFAASTLLVQGLPIEEYSTAISGLDNTLKARDACDDADPIRGVNIGGWLVIEPWMNWELVAGTDAVDQWTFDQTSNAESKLQSHWASWFTESDMAQIAAWGLNTVRIPIGYWAYTNGSDGTPYITGADAYLETALGWARQYGIQAVICLHGLAGSQNGFDNSGHKGNADWAENQANLAAATSILETVVSKYGTTGWADVIWGIELVNEPIVWDQTSASSVQSWVVDTVKKIRALISNPDLKLIMHDAFVGAQNWLELGQSINTDDENFVLDLHLYQNQGGSTSDMTQDQHIDAVCQYPSTQFLPDSARLPIVVGEFTDQTNICVDASGNITAGTSCSTSGCQCSAQLDPSQWNSYLIDATRKYMEAQMDVFEENSLGWFLWSYTGPGAWGLDNLFSAGVVGPNTVTERKFPAQCS